MNKKNKMKGYSILILSLLLIFTSCKSKEEKKELQTNDKKEIKYVYDFSRVLSNDEKEDLEKLLKGISSEDGVQYVFCSVNNEEQEDIDVLSERYFTSLDIGANDYSNRILILISVITRDFKISLGETINESIPKEELLQVRNETINYFSESQFYDGLKYAFNELHENLTSKAM